MTGCQGAYYKTMEKLGVHKREILVDRIEAVLNAFSDQVLFLKHNLNAQAIASFKEEVVSVEADVAVLIRDMEASIAKADSFIATMTGE